MAKRVLLYGVLLAGGTLVLDWLDFQRLARTRTEEIALFLMAAGFLALGVYLGAKVIAPQPRSFDGNPQALAALGISPREFQVLQQVAAGRSNQQIADGLGVSLNTVKTHVARLLDKLGAARRTDAIARARELGILR